MIIRYKISPILRIPVTWVTEITEVDDMSRFVDVQRTGPYSLWRHEHIFEEKNGAVEVKDRVSYALPLGPLGSVVHALDTKKRLDRIFEFRREYVERRFGAAARD